MRFCPLIRVSTEAQEKKGESLKTQKKQIIQAVEILKGIIPKHCWKYSGQEHATPQMDRQKLDMLLEYANKDIFDAIVVADGSRWSRDNLKSKQGIEIFKNTGIRFFITTTEYDLFNPEHVLFLSLSVEVGEFQASQNAKKSILNKIERLRQNIPASGSLPYGRTYDKESGKWGIDELKKKRIQKAAEMYLRGDSFETVAKRTGINTAYLYQILMKRCSDTYEVEFKSKKFNIYEKVVLKVPRLLPEATIEEMRKKSEAAKTFTHGESKYKYLLQRMIFCGHCNRPMFGSTQHGKFRYYKHTERCDCKAFSYIRCDDIEQAVMEDIRYLIGDRKAREDAMKKAAIGLAEIKTSRNKKQNFEKELAKVKKDKSRLVQAVIDEILPEDTIKEKMKELTERERLIREDIQKIDAKLNSMVTEEQIKQRAKVFDLKKQVLDEQLQHSFYGSKAHFNEMSFEEKRALLQILFAGKDADGKRLGVYLEKKNDKWIYVIKGAFPEIVGTVGKLKNNINKILVGNDQLLL